MPSACILLAAVAAAGLLAGSAGAQRAAGPPLAAKPRVFAPGVLTVIPTDLNPEETTSVHDVVELRSDRRLDWRPKLVASSRTAYAQAEASRFRREVWQLEFAFKPLRMIYIDLPNPAGALERRLVWYMVYRVTNRGDALRPVEGEEGLFSAEQADPGPQRFLAHFVLEGHDVDASGEKLYRAYLDRVVPAAVEPIRRREAPGRRLLTSVEMTRRPIPVSRDGQERPVWGVATWLDVDPEIDFFSVFVRGLTNAYRWKDAEGGFERGQPPGTGRRFVRKTLQLNFWRPGDRYLPHESEVRFGAAPGKESLYSVAPGVAHQWVYR